MRDRLWVIATAKHPEGMMLPGWLLVVRALLYPLDFFYWQMSKSRGYQYESDTWTIEGVRYSGRMMRALANAQGDTYRITRYADRVTMDRVDA